MGERGGGLSQLPTAVAHARGPRHHVRVAAFAFPPTASSGCLPRAAPGVASQGLGAAQQLGVLGRCLGLATRDGATTIGQPRSLDSGSKLQGQ